jgi:hypothetical protein
VRARREENNTGGNDTNTKTHTHIYIYIYTDARVDSRGHGPGLRADHDVEREEQAEKPRAGGQPRGDAWRWCERTKPSSPRRLPH